MKILNALPFLEQRSSYEELPEGTFTQRLKALQVAGLQAYQKQGFPTLKTETWQFTPVQKLLKHAFVPAPETDIKLANLPVEVQKLAQEEPTLIFVNGRVIPTALGPHSRGDGRQEEFKNLPQSLGQIASLDRNPFVALNAAHVSPDMQFLNFDGKESFLHLVFVSANMDKSTIYYPRFLVNVAAEAKATLIEHHISMDTDQPVFTNMVMEVEIGQNAGLQRVKLQHLSENVFHIAHTAVRVRKGACFNSFVFQDGGQLSRDEISVKLSEPGAHAELLGIYKAQGVACIDNTTFIDHAVPHCTSREVYHGVIDDQARGVFQGKVLVRPEAQKTDAQQMNRALLLSDMAQINSKPELQIYADDVKCSHGATAGELDEQALFYLQSRGLNEASARALLIRAFLNEVIEDLKDEALQGHVVKCLERSF